MTQLVLTDPVLKSVIGNPVVGGERTDDDPLIDERWYWPVDGRIDGVVTLVDSDPAQTDIGPIVDSYCYCVIDWPSWPSQCIDWLTDPVLTQTDPDPVTCIVVLTDPVVIVNYWPPNWGPIVIVDYWPIWLRKLLLLLLVIGNYWYYWLLLLLDNDPLLILKLLDSPGTQWPSDSWTQLMTVDPGRTGPVDDSWCDSDPDRRTVTRPRPTQTQTDPVIDPGRQKAQTQWPSEPDPGRTQPARGPRPMTQWPGRTHWPLSPVDWWPSPVRTPVDIEPRQTQWTDRQLAQ